MAKTKEISRRIKSVTSTKKITKAMEMVAAAKMRKAIDAVLKTRTYAKLSWETVLHLAKLAESRSDSLHTLLTPRSKIEKVAIILITSNRGMCGGYNSAIIAKARELIKNNNTPTDFIIVGKKGAIVHNYKYEIAAEFEKSDVITDAKEIYPVVKLALSDYQNKKYDKIFVAYTDFVNPAKQIPRLKQLLPIELEKTDENLGQVEGQEQDNHNIIFDYTFEPNPAEVLDRIIPRLLEVQLYQAFLEANASEHSARMTAMHQATEAANDMVAELTLFYNKARQAGITAEIAEISAGANALAE